jgi:phage gpG-like protein
MLQAMVTRAPASASGGELTATIGIYGDEADRAEGHNEGSPKTKLPRRRFLDASASDQKAMAADVADRVQARVKTLA